MLLDHVFVVVRRRRQDDRSLRCTTLAGADEFTSRLRTGGFHIGSSRAHAGQGTVNRRCFFDDFMVECLYVDDEAALDHPRGAALRLGTRFRDPRASAFGFGFRPGDPDGSAPDFPAVAYRPAYLPDGWHIDVCDAPDAAMPLLFHLPFAARGEGVPEDSEPRHHPNGARHATDLYYQSECPPSSQAVRTLSAAGVSCGSGPESLHVGLAGMDGEVDLRPLFPLRLHG